MENSYSKPSKKKQFGKNNSLTSVESLKTPKIRRKSLGTVLPTPKVVNTSLDLNRRQSVESSQNTKKSKKQKISKKSSRNTITAPINQNNKGEGKYVKNSSESSPSLTLKTAVKRLVNVNESATSHDEKENKTQLNKTPLVLAPRKKKQSNSTAKNVTKTPQNELDLKLKDESNSENKERIEDLEKKFSIKSKDVENAIEGVIKFASNNPHLQNQLFNEEIPLFLQVNSFKIPKTKGQVKQLFRVPMPHSILPADADICLIVPDVKGIKNNEHEKHLEHYETLLRSKDITEIKKIMTFHEFRTEYETFELKNRLVDLYDAFLVDGKISGKVVNKCGSIFYNKRKVPIAIKLYISKLKSHIDKALKKAYFHLNVKSDSHTVQIGHSKNNTEDLVDNVYSAVEFLEKQFPGKMDNIRSLNVYAHRGSSIPIYISLKNPNEVKVPILSNKKPKAYKTFRGELTTQYNAEVVVRPSGHVIVKRKKAYSKPKEEEIDDNITDAEILRENRKIDQMEQQNGDGSNKSKKGGKKRKISEPTNNQQESNPAQSGPKKIKREKQPSMSAKEVVTDHGTKQTTGYKGKKKNNNKNNRSPTRKGNTDESGPKPVKKKTTFVATKAKIPGTGRRARKQKMTKNKIRR